MIDACAHVMPGSRDEFIEYMHEPWRSRLFPGPERYHYAFAQGEYAPDAPLIGDGCTAVVLLPLTRGLHPNVNLATAICAATNAWLADRFLAADPRLYGTIRVEPRDPVAAVAEIERWAGHPQMVQVGVPTHSLSPYGSPTYLPIWQAAAAHGLPVAVHADGGSGVEFPPTAAGYPQHSLEYSTMAPLNWAFHLVNMIAEGTFHWVERLVIVFADGGFDLLWPLVWRLDKDWRGNRDEVPAAALAPGEYLRDHVRFVLHRFEGPAAPEARRDWLSASAGAEDLLLFGSNSPQWDFMSVQDAADSLPEPMRERVLRRNAEAIYSIGKEHRGS